MCCHGNNPQVGQVWKECNQDSVMNDMYNVMNDVLMDNTPT